MDDHAHEHSGLYYLLLGCGFTAVLIGLWAATGLERTGHVATGMDNQVVWGLPHVFAIFLIVCASGVLNIATVGSLFGQKEYKARAPLSGLLSIAMLSGGLSVLVLDLGRPERLTVAMTHFNFHSVFAWNVFLYSGLFAIVLAYLWTLMERRFNRHASKVGVIALFWRFALTSGTGSIFGFLVARQAYQSALLAPLFIVASLAWGLAVFLLVQASMMAWNGRLPDQAIMARLHRLLAVFVGLTAYLVLMFHVTNLYYARQSAFERFILFDGAAFPSLLWVGYGLIGTALPLFLLLTSGSRRMVPGILASALVLVGAGALLYTFIIGGQSFPLPLFPGYEVSSSFGDGQIAHYVPSLPEICLGIGGFGLAFVMVTVGVHVLQFLPDDDLVHARSAEAAAS